MVPAPFVAWRLELLLDAGRVVREGLALDDLTEAPHPSPRALSLSLHSVCRLQWPSPQRCHLHCLTGHAEGASSHVVVQGNALLTALLSRPCAIAAAVGRNGTYHVEPCNRPRALGGLTLETLE